MNVTGTIVTWQARAACLSADPDLFFPISTTGSDEQQIARAKRICARCAVRVECLEFALAHDQMYGIWGGTTPDDRRRDRRRRRRREVAAQKRTSHRGVTGGPQFTLSPSRHNSGRGAG